MVQQEQTKLHVKSLARDDIAKPGTPKEAALGAKVALKWARLLFWYASGQFVVFKAFQSWFFW